MKMILLILLVSHLLVACTPSETYCSENAESVEKFRNYSQEELSQLYGTMQSLIKNNYSSYRMPKDSIPEEFMKYKFTGIRFFSKHSAIGYLEFCSFDYRVYVSFNFHEDSSKDNIILHWGGDLELGSQVVFSNLKQNSK